MPDDSTHLRAVVVGAPVVLFFADRRGVCTVCGGHGQTTHPHGDGAVGRAAADLFGDGPLWLPDGRTMTGAEAVEQALEGEALQAECRAGDRLLEVRLRPQVDETSGMVVGVVGVIADVSHRAPLAPSPSRLLEEQRAPHERTLSDRLAAVDTLAAGLAHEINNPLTYTLINVEHVLRRLRFFVGEGASPRVLRELAATLPSFVESLAQTLHGVQRVREVVRNLTTFCCGGVDSSTLVDVRGVAESAIQMALHQVVPRARLVRELGEVSPVMANHVRLRQVFLSLIVNAAQSLPDGDGRQHEVRVSTRMSEGKVVVEVSDTGVGIPPEVLPRIFDPFFTSRGSARAAGMGLSLCYGTVKKLGGEIVVTSRRGQGACFRVFLRPAHVPRALAAVSGLNAGGRSDRRVLVLDEDPLVGEGLARALSDVAEVTVLTDASVVLEKLGSGDRWDVLLCDVAMPGMSGIDVYREVLRVAPDAAARIIFMTAGVFAPQARAFLDSVGNACLEKPFDVARVRSLVSRIVLN